MLRHDFSIFEMAKCRLDATGDDGRQTLSLISDYRTHINNSLFAIVSPQNESAIIVESRTDINLYAVQVYSLYLSLLLLTYEIR